MIFIGVDPGKTGGLAIVRNGYCMGVTPMLIAGKDVDFVEVAGWVRRMSASLCANAIAYIEKVHAMPKQGVTSMFKFGFVTGGVHGVLAALKIPRHLVTPHAWKKEILAGTKKDKLAAIDYVRSAYPDISLLATPRSRKCHSGMADAVCIAEYGYRTHK